jgi:hypothetical protein
MDFLNHGGGGMVSIRFSSFLLTVYSSCNVETVRGCVSLKKRNLKAICRLEVTLNSKEETFVSISIQELGLCTACYKVDSISQKG